MKLRHIISFSLQLFVPETVIKAFESSSPTLPVASPRTDSPDESGTVLAASTGNSKNLFLIRELDSAKFGGPSFGEDTISVMAKALDQAVACLPLPIEQATMNELAQTILDRAADGERNSDHLRQAAMDHFAVLSHPIQET